MENLTFTDAKRACRALGFTLRRTIPGESEMVLYLIGTGADSPSAYFTDCPADALGTARAWFESLEADAKPENRARALLSRVVNRCIANGSPVFTEMRAEDS